MKIILYVMVFVFNDMLHALRGPFFWANKILLSTKISIIL